MPQIFDITNWYPLEYYNTGGTRDKKYFQNPEGEFYYFKSSLKKPNKDYKYEFWSEIIAYEIGKEFKFDILKYDIAIYGDKIGCLSKNMINPAKEELIQGGQYLQAFDNTFNPDDGKQRHLYTFKLIEETLEAFKLNKQIEKFVEEIIFDALIGNGDRHQDNWAFICGFSPLSKSIKEIEYSIENNNLDVKPKWLQSVIKKIYIAKDGKKIKPELKIIKLQQSKNARFAPIYDSGSSLGRELTTEKVNEMLKDDSAIERYVTKGTAEIHWEKKKISHFDLIRNLKNNYNKQVSSTIERIGKQFNENKIKSIGLFRI